MSDKNLETWVAVIGGFSLLALLFPLFYQLWKQKKLKQTEESKFFNPGGNTVTYTLNNTAADPKVASLFGRLPSGGAAGVQVTGGAAGLAADIQAHPVKVKKIKIISQNSQQVQNPIQISCSSPTGKKVSYYKRPAISPTSFRKDVVELKPNVVLSGACKLNYEVEPHTKANFTLTLGKSLPGEFDPGHRRVRNPRRNQRAKKRELLREMKIIE